MKMKNKSVIYIILGLALLPQLAKAGPVKIRITDSIMVIGDTIDYPVYVDSSLTGENVISYQLDLTFTTGKVEILDVISTGTLSEGMGSVTFGVPANGKLKIAAAGITPLTGTGKLIYIRVRSLSTGYVYFNFVTNGETGFNEGTPGVITDNGYINIAARPTLNISPVNVTLTSGEQRQFSVSGGTAPYSWDVSVDSVAGIGSTGLLTALKRGKTKIIVTDDTGIIDTSYFEVEVRAVELDIHDTTGWQANQVSVPIYINDVTGLGINSGNFTLSFSNAHLEAAGFELTGTLLDGENVEYSKRKNGQASFAFAIDQPLTGTGKLMNVIFNISAGATGSPYIYLSNILFNEDIYANFNNGYISISILPELNITPSIAQFAAGSMQQFNVTNGQAPFNWSVTNTSIAEIDGSGLLSAYKSGVVHVVVNDNLGAEGSSGEIKINGAETFVNDTTLGVDNTCGYHRIPVRIAFHSVHDSIIAFEMELTIDTARMVFNAIDKAGKLLDNWSVFANLKGNKIKIAGAGIDKIKQNGVLFDLLIKFKPQVTAGQVSNITFSTVDYNEGLPLSSVNSATIHAGTTQQKDISVNSIAGPVSTCAPGNIDSVTIELENAGNQVFVSCWPINVIYEVNGAIIASDVITLGIDFLPGATISHTFSQPYGFTAEGSYEIKAYTAVNGDVDMSNDTSYLDVEISDNQNVDLAVTSLNGPVNACGSGAVNFIEITVENTGITTLGTCHPIYVAYQVNSGTVYRDSIILSGGLMPGATINHAFSQGYDFTAVGEYGVRAFLANNFDVDNGNDTSVLTVNTYSNPVTDLGPDFVASTFPVTLDAGAGMDTYNWSTSQSSQQISVNAAGTYWVEVSLNGCTDGDTVVVSEAIGIGGLNNLVFRVFPNPVGNYLVIETDKRSLQNADVYLVNLLGKKLMLNAITAGIGETKFDVSAIHPGSYILVVQQGGSSGKRLITIKR